MRARQVVRQLFRVLAFRVLPLLVLLELGLQVEWRLRDENRHPAPSGPGFRIVVLGNSVSGQYAGRLSAELNAPANATRVFVDQVTVGALAPAGLIRDLEAHLSRSPAPDLVIAMMGLSQREAPSASGSWHLLTWILLRDSLHRLWGPGVDPGSAAIGRALDEPGLADVDRMAELSAALSSCEDFEVCLSQVELRCPSVIRPVQCSEVVRELIPRLASSGDARRLENLGEALTTRRGREAPTALEARLAADRLRDDAPGFIEEVRFVLFRGATATGFYLWPRLYVVQAQWFADAAFAARLGSLSGGEETADHGAWRMVELARHMARGDLGDVAAGFSADPLVRRAIFEYHSSLAARDMATADRLIEALVARHPASTAQFWSRALATRLQSQDREAALRYVEARLASSEWRRLLAAGRDRPFSDRAVMALAAGGRCDDARELLGRIRGDQIAIEDAPRVEDLCSGRAPPTPGRDIDAASTDDLTEAYARLGALGQKYGFDVIAMQYPTWPLAELEKRLPPGYKMRLVDNEAAFGRAVEEHGRLAVFSDLEGGTFGHLTDLGLDVLMEDLVPVVNEVMRQRDMGDSVAMSGTPSGGDGP